MTAKSGLDIVSIPNLIQSIANERQTGTLKVQSGSEEKYLYFQNGKILQASSPQKPSILAEGLRRHPDLEEDSYQAVCEEQRRTGKSLASILLEGDDDNTDMVNAICEFQITEEICEMFPWQDCHSEFSPGEPEAMMFDLELMNIKPVDTNIVLLEGAKREEEWKSIEEVLPSLKDVPFRTVNPSQNIDDEEKIVLQVIDGFSDIENLTGVVRLSPFNTMKNLASLVRKKFLALKSSQELLKMAKLDLFREDFHKRVRLYERAMELGEESREIKIWLAHSYEAMGIKDKAASQYLDLGRQCLEDDILPASITAYEKAVALNPRNAFAQESLMNLFAKMERMSEYADSTTSFARWLSLQGDKDRAMLLLQEATEKSPGHLKSLDLLGALYQECGYRVEAVNIYRKLAKLQAEQEQFEEAVKTYQGIILLATEKMGVRRELADLFEKMGRTSEAIDQYRAMAKLAQGEGKDGVDNLIYASDKIINHDESDLSAYKWLADAYTMKKDKDLAIQNLSAILEKAGDSDNEILVEALKKVVKLTPENIEHRLRLSEMYLKMKREREAIQEFYACGVQAAKQNDKTKALEAFDRVLMIDPSNYATRLKKSEMLIEQGESAKAIEELKVTGHLSLGSDKLWQAVKAFRQVLSLDREEVDCYLDLARVYEKLGKKKEAIAAHKKNIQKSVKLSNFGRALQSCERILALEENHEWAQVARQKILNTLPKIQDAFQSST